MTTKIIKLTNGKLSDLGYSDTLLQPHIDNGYSLIDESLIQLDASGNKYSHYKLDASGNYIPDTDAITAFVTEQTTLKGEQIVEAYIQSIVDAYNTKHGVKFANVHNCANYTSNPNYAHYQFCSDVWNFNISVWETGRILQQDIANGNVLQPQTEDEFIALLPEYTGVM